ncbi:hypothetical protein HHK36_022530 [Tetracentron sinense]|uniref:Uncharacterized protein n=1 Tax=Tetracentron sinense TaxID=13715 RepID=A0A835D6E3_TETSI|nr:hypothetical protein HHK36_022530 [Tetracentron sinense]
MSSNSKTIADENRIEIIHEQHEIHGEDSDSTAVVEGENTFTTELKPWAKKAMLEFRCKVEDAILGNYILRRPHGNISIEESSKPKEIENHRDISIWGDPSYT